MDVISLNDRELYILLLYTCVLIAFNMP